MDDFHFSSSQHGQSSFLQETSTPNSPVTSGNDPLSFDDGQGGGGRSEERHGQAEDEAGKGETAQCGPPLFRSGSKLKRSGPCMCVCECMIAMIMINHALHASF